MPKKTYEPSFEENLAELSNLIEKLEEGQIPLDTALQYFEKGVELTRCCQQKLQKAQQKVATLTESQTLKPFIEEE